MTQKKYTIKISLTKTVFSFARSVDALQNTCILSKQKKTLGTEVFWQKNAKKVMKNHILKPPTFYFDNALINTAS